MSQMIEVRVPDIGDFDEVEVIEVLVKPGDTVVAEQSLITVESDKASMEIPSSAAGVVKTLRVAVGDKVAKGSVVLELEEALATGAAAAAPAPAYGKHQSRRGAMGSGRGRLSQRLGASWAGMRRSTRRAVH